MKKLILLALIFFSGIFVKAQNQDSLVISLNDVAVSPEKVWCVKAFIQDEKKLWMSPVKMMDKDKLYWAPVFGATIIALSRDEKIYSEVKKFQAKHQWVSDLSPVVTYGGENVTTLSTCALFYFGGLVFKNDKAKQTGLMATEALLHAGFIVTLGKLFTGRQRPSFDNGKDYWNWFPTSLNAFKKDYKQSGYDAFPSGHTIAAWSVATVIAKQYKDIKIVPIICYTLATGVGISRLTQDAHWMSDVIIGGALGYSIGSFVVRERTNTKFSLLPVTDGKSVMLSSTFKF
ncbi:MAG TPA: phosphatase PAP2 family protein [Bacteroidales bacterium]|nr:phosphatase PAP2 family protein [Bacteroidales bacterium]HPS16337.1 phosphatase PAP2 family protein [Bacteroidales bacterium]